ncbi:MAG TPA: hypothetical protein DEQ34_15015 [Balneolaceae bacterium]|nr:hypothetical protein [Balneolaceae bacterium]|tara:strand:+ start:117599 stop:118057 length:459 start_codon:yes stop_codon:yes gene_type:complete
MNKKSIIAVVIVGFIAFFMYNALHETTNTEIPNAPDWQTLETGQKVASESEKLILVDVYEDGCKYCRAMERETYPDPTVRAVLDAGYVPVKINGNSDEMITFNGEAVNSREWAKEFGVFVYPTTIILDADGKEIKKKTGYMNVDEFRQFLYR